MISIKEALSVNICRIFPRLDAGCVTGLQVCCCMLKNELFRGIPAVVMAGHNTAVSASIRNQHKVTLFEKQQDYPADQ